MTTFRWRSAAAWIAAGAAFGAFAGGVEVTAFHAASGRFHAPTAVALMLYGAAACAGLALLLGVVHLLASRAGPRAVLIGPGLLAGGLLAALLGVRCLVDGDAVRYALQPANAGLVAGIGALGALGVALPCLRSRASTGRLASGVLLAAIALVYAPFLGRLALGGHRGVVGFAALVALGVCAAGTASVLGGRLRVRSAALLGMAALALPPLWRVAVGPPPQHTILERPPSLVSARVEDPLHVILIVIDTLRADHLELHGYERETMPRLARFAERAVVYSSCLANSSWSLPSHATLLTGLYPREHGAVYRAAAGPTSEAQALPETATTLAEILRSRGYRTAAISSNYAYVAPRYGLSQGFDYWDSRSGLRGAMAGGFWPALLKNLALVEKLPIRWILDPLVRFDIGQVPYRRAEEINAEVGSLLDQAALPGAPPLFLLVNYMEPHDPFHPPAEFQDFFPGRRPDLPRDATDLPRKAHRPALFSLMSDDAVREHFFGLYDSELAYLDLHLGRLLDRIEETGLLTRSLVVITSDHGEQFLEHEGWFHGQALYQEEVHVPLIVYDPEAAPARVEHPVEHRDVMPWVLERLRLPLPPDVEPSDLTQGRRPKVAELLDSELGHQTALRRSSLTLLRSERGAQLYDLQSDPAQTRDLARAEPAALRRLTAEWERWSRSRPVRSGAELELDTDELERLRELGYVE